MTRGAMGKEVTGERCLRGIAVTVTRKKSLTLIIPFSTRPHYYYYVFLVVGHVVVLIHVHTVGRHVCFTRFREY